MALINCPECGKQVSDSAKMCPHCGYELFDYKLRNVKKPPQYAPQPKKKKNGCLLAFLISVIILFIPFVVANDDSSDDANTVSNQEQVTSSGTIPLKYKILKSDKIDVPLKTQVALTIVLTDEATKINKQSISKLLSNLYNEIKNRTGFKYHTHPTNVYVWAFTTKDKANAGMGQWVGMISGVGTAPEPDLKISDIQLNSLSLKPVEKFGLSEKTRLAIWHKAIRVEDRAQEETDAKYPTDKKGITQSYLMKSYDYRDKLEIKYEKELVREYRITKAILDSICYEAGEKGWAYPSMHLFD